MTDVLDNSSNNTAVTNENFHSELKTVGYTPLLSNHINSVYGEDNYENNQNSLSNTSDGTKMNTPTSSISLENKNTDESNIEKHNVNLLTVESPNLDLEPTDILSFQHMKVGDEVNFKFDNCIPIKIVIVGDASVGKTSLLLNYIKHNDNKQISIDETDIPNVLDDYRHYVDGPQNKQIEFSLWDVSTEEKDDVFRPFAYNATDVTFVCYSVDNQASLTNAENVWVPEVKHFASNTPIILVGLKKDLYYDKELDSEDDLVDCKDADEVYRNLKLNGHIQVSSKHEYNINELFNNTINLVINKKLAEIQAPSDMMKNIFPSKTKNSKKKKKKSKCTIL